MDALTALTATYGSKCRARIELSEIAIHLQWRSANLYSVKDIIECKQLTKGRQLQKQFNYVFGLFDIHDSGLVSKSDIYYYLMKIKDIVSAQLDFSLIKDFD